jgi:hypothetical protein
LTKIDKTNAHKRRSRGDSNDAVGMSRSPKTRRELKRLAIAEG